MTQDKDMRKALEDLLDVVVASGADEYIPPSAIADARAVLASAPTEECPACGTTVDEPTHDPTCPLVTQDQPAPTYTDEDVRRLRQAAQKAYDAIFPSIESDLDEDDKLLSKAGIALFHALAKFPQEPK